MRRLMMLSALAVAPAVLAAGPTGLLNDSGQTQCLNAAGNALEPCSAANTGDAAPFPRQDARFGRDAAASAAALPPKTGGGAGGFDFTKLDADGQPLAIQNQAWSFDGSGYDNGSEAAGTQWSCVQDNVTHLIWEVKTHVNPADLRDWGWRYAWGGTAGATTCGGTLTGFCNSDNYVAAVNALNIGRDYGGVDAFNIGLCGGTGWRLPTRRELLSIVHYGVDSPAIDAGFFPNTTIYRYWSSNLYLLTDPIFMPAPPAAAWSIDFRGGYYGIDYLDDVHTYVRLVRSGQ
jgi:hypothetical protein